MDFGASMFFTDYSIRPDELARALEARGFESVWAPEHSHIPLSRNRPSRRWRRAQALFRRARSVRQPDRGRHGDQDAQDRDRHLPGGAARSDQTAKLVASIDQISGGRFLFGIGAGWNAEEMENHGTAFKTRFALMRERVEAMKAIWTQSKPEYHGEFVNFDR
ncbi:MAG: LLM class flavin-dependent oxidoreductase [Pseudomonadota bacterium]